MILVLLFSCCRLSSSGIMVGFNLKMRLRILVILSLMINISDFIILCFASLYCLYIFRVFQPETRNIKVIFEILHSHFHTNNLENHKVYPQ